MTLSQWASWAQVVIALVGMVSLFVSMALSRRALYETRVERQWRLSPYLHFQNGLYQVPVEIIAGAGPAIPGIARESAREILTPMEGMDGSDSVTPKEFYGELVNLGLGPAIDVNVSWLTGSVVTREGASVPVGTLFSEGLNVMPTLPRVIPPGQHGQLTRFPSYLVKDIGHTLSEAHGYLKVVCKDLGGGRHVKYQAVHLWIDWSRGFTPIVEVTFGDQVEAPDTGGERLKGSIRRRSRSGGQLSARAAAGEDTEPTGGAVRRP
jgi:hypothetical protein